MGALSYAYELRSLLRPLQESFRVRFCGCGTVSGDPELVVREFGKAGERRAHWKGIMLCQRQYACPVCATRRQAERLSEVDAMMRADRNARYQMVTLTLRHHLGQSLASLLVLLFAAWRRVRATRRVREIFSRRVNATARSLEVTFGFRNGWHPHIHLLLQTSEWTAEEQATLAEEWERALPGMTERGVAVVWSTPMTASHAGRARYIAKLAGELAGIAKQPKRGNVGVWELARAALHDAGARALWREYVTAMRGRRVLELDERAKALAKVGAETSTPTSEWIIPLVHEEYRALAALEKRFPRVLWQVLEAARTAGADPPGVARALIDKLLPLAPRVFPVKKYAEAAA